MMVVRPCLYRKTIEFCGRHFDTRYAPFTSWRQARVDAKRKYMFELHQDDRSEPFFITEKAEAELVAAGYEFKPPSIACTVRLRDVLKGMSEDELALQPGEIADQEREHRQNKPFSAG